MIRAEPQPIEDAERLGSGDRGEFGGLTSGMLGDLAAGPPRPRSSDSGTDGAAPARSSPRHAPAGTRGGRLLPAPLPT